MEDALSYDVANDVAEGDRLVARRAEGARGATWRGSDKAGPVARNHELPALAELEAAHVNGEAVGVLAPLATAW
jgi:hypothetical protein